MAHGRGSAPDSMLSFIALGAVLMGIFYIYYRDWLQLSLRVQKNSIQRTAP